MTARALFAIATARLYAERRVVLYACAAALFAGLLQPRGAAGPMLLGSLLGVAVALTQSPGRRPYLDRSEQGAPLFGRELARAKALVPCIAAAIAVGAYLCGQFLAGSRDGLALAVAPIAVVAATLTALSAAIRRGWNRAVYLALALAAAAAAYVLVVVARSIPGELAFCALVSFFALRQYGEALARYDPVEGI